MTAAAVCYGVPYKIDDLTPALANTRIYMKTPGGFCQQKHSHRNKDSKTGPGGRKTGRERKETDKKTTKTYTDLKGFCIKALTVCAVGPFPNQTVTPKPLGSTRSRSQLDVGRCSAS
jgi:hypothetical protein